MRRLFNTDCSWTRLFQRLVVAAVLFPHGAQKLLGAFGGMGPKATFAAFQQGGMPAPLIVLVMATEFLAPIALLVGFLTRLAALGVAALMAGAILLVHLPNGFFMNWFGNQKGEGFEYHILMLGLALPLLLFGAGRASLDRAIATRIERRRAAKPATGKTFVPSAR